MKAQKSTYELYNNPGANETTMKSQQKSRLRGILEACFELIAAICSFALTFPSQMSSFRDI
jgi:hypothetical protein